MKSEFCHFFQLPFQNVTQAYLEAVSQRFGRDCRHSQYTIQFGLNTPSRYNIGDCPCVLYFMPYQDGTAVYLQMISGQAVGEGYKAFDDELLQYVCGSLGAPLMDIDIPRETFVGFASSNGDVAASAVPQNYTPQQYAQPQQYVQPQQYAQSQQYVQQPQFVQQPQQQGPMLQRTKVGLIIWGAILSFFGLIAVVSAMNTSGSGRTVAIISCLLFLAGGVIMLVFGIRSAVLVKRNNTQIINDGKEYFASCPYCRSMVRAQTKDFRPHRNFPEGFLYCPACKKPISRNTFGS